MKRRLYAYVLIGVVFAALLPPAHCKVARASLTDLVKNSDQIVIGTVVAVEHIEGVKVATLEVDTTLKGVELGHLYFLAVPTWACDVSDAQLGEHILLFLVQHTFGPRPEFAFLEPPGLRTDAFREELISRSGVDRFFEISWAGRGRRQLIILDGTEYVQVGAIHLPEHVATISLPLPGNDSVVRLVQLNDFVAAINDEIMQESPLDLEPSSVHPRLQ
jgi:hypothetical protein